MGVNGIVINDEGVLHMTAVYEVSATYKKRVNDILKMLGSTLPVDYIYICKRYWNESGSAVMKLEYEWRKPAYSKQPDFDFGSMQLKPLEKWYDSLTKGKIVAGNIDTFNGVEREELRYYNIVSIAQVPIFTKGGFWGFIGLHNLGLHNYGSKLFWDQNIMLLLKTTANNIGDIAQLLIFENSLKYLKNYDELTEVYKRVYIEKRIKVYENPKYIPLSVINIDLNGLRLINDVLGYNKGDRFIIATADILRKHCHMEDIITRWGGDEFMVLLPRKPKDTVKQLCKLIKEECEKTYINGMSLSVAIGFATKTQKDEKLTNIIHKAEDLMYKQKLLENKSFSNSILSSFKHALLEKSHETSEHADRIKNICLKIGQYLGLYEEQLCDLELLSVLHDIGKIGVNDKILEKPGKLTKSEWMSIKMHPEIGYRIAYSAPEFISVADAILYHHERWDGTGYPIGLKAEDIPLLSRILSVADSYDAMINDRPYKEAISKNEAILEIKANAGKQFDPIVVKAFLSIADDLL